MDGETYFELKAMIGRKFGEVNYYATQVLSSHGYFRKHRTGKAGSPYCLYEEGEVNTLFSDVHAGRDIALY